MLQYRASYQSDSHEPILCARRRGEKDATRDVNKSDGVWKEVDLLTDWAEDSAADGDNEQ